MLQLYLKTIAAAILLLAFILSSYFLGFSYFAQQSETEINQLLSKGTLEYVQSVLSTKDKLEWQSTVEKIRPLGSNSAKIISIDSLRLSNKNKSQLMDGKIIFLRGKNYIFLYYGVVETFAIQRIGSTNDAIQLELGITIDDTIQKVMGWIIPIISQQIQTAPEEKQQEILEKLQLQFGIPLHLETEIKTKIRNNSLGFLPDQNAKPISVLYYPLPNINKILVVGPIQYGPVSRRFRDMQRYYFTTFSIISVLIVVFLTWLFNRNIFKIYQLTKKYSQGDFSSHAKISHLSVLNGVHKNIVAMGNNLKLLIQSQQNMTRFVAHEIRTPLSTMQLAVDALNKEHDLSDSSKQNLASIQEDIHDLNKLLSYFLLYSQSKSHELKLKKESICLHGWLEKIINRYQSSTIHTTLIDPNDEKKIVNFDPNLLKHAIDNLLTNALKFANKEVIVSLDISGQAVRIHVDDDGAGISQEDREKVFEPFITLASNQAFGKHIGLGLALAKAIVELHAGSIAITESYLLGGARFTVQFPLE